MSATTKLGFPQQYVHVEMAQSEKKKKKQHCNITPNTSEKGLSLAE